MLQDFFESPEIAAIFSAKDKDKGSVDTNERSRLRVSKHSRKHEQHTKRPIRTKVRGHQQNSVAMFSARNSKKDNEEKIASLHEEIDYYDYDDETGTIIKKKHSAFGGYGVVMDSKQTSKDSDKPEIDVDINRDDFTRQVTNDLSNGGDGYCPSDSAYDTNHDDFTDSLERLMIKDDVVAGGDSFIHNSSKNKFAKSAGNRESPYRRCRSSAICGRNCEICRGKNNNILPTKHKHSKKHIKEADNQMYARQKPETRYEMATNVGEKPGFKNCGMFSSKSNKENAVSLAKHINHKLSIDSEHDVNQVHGPTSLDSALQERFEGVRDSISSSPLSAASLENFDISLHDEEYYNSRVPPYSEDFHLEIERGPINGQESIEFVENVECIDEYPLPNLGNALQTCRYEEFSRGPHLLMLYDFKAEHEDDITAWKGEIIMLLDNRDRDWVWVMTRTGDEGYIPRSLAVPYNDCEECRQEELRQRKILEKSEAGSSASTPRSTRTSSRSSTTSTKSNTNHPANAISPKQSPAASIASHDHSGIILFESNLVHDELNPNLNYATSHEISRSKHVQNNTPRVQNNSHSQVTNLLQSQTIINPSDSLCRTENQAVVHQNSQASASRDRTSPRVEKPLSEAENVNKISPRMINTHPRQSSVRSNTSLTRLHKSNSISNDNTPGHEKEGQMLKNDGIKLIALSSFYSNDSGKLSVSAGDIVYVDLKEQKVPNWLWAYSPASKCYGFIPENVIDQLKSSIV